MSKHCVLSASIQKAVTEDDTVIIYGKASTSATDRVGDIITSDAWVKNNGLENYKKNPIMLFNHNYSMPIGFCSEVKAVADGIEIRAEISDEKIGKLIKNNVLKTFSVGFLPKEYEINRSTGGYIITDAELLEISVVSVPANQEAIFHQVKTWSDSEFKSYIEKLKGAANNLQVSASGGQSSKIERKPMDPEEIKKLIAEAQKDAIATYKMESAKEKAAKVAAEKAAAEKAAELEATKKVAIEAGTSGAEKLLEEVKKQMADMKNANEQTIETLKKELTDYSTEVDAIRKSKRVFEGANSKTWEEAHADEIVDTHILGLATKKGWHTETAKRLIEKASSNTDSGVSVPAPDVNPFENITSTTIERDIQNELILYPLFREIQMNSSTMTLPILPDSGYATFAKTSPGSAPHGNLQSRGDTPGSPYAGNDLTAKILRVSTLVSSSFLGDETEEDSIIPILPLLRESIVRSHARTTENQLLLGGHASSNIVGGFDGMVEMAKDASNTVVSSTAFASDKLTAAGLLDLRTKLGKYGVRPSDVTYVVSQAAYFDLLKDGEFQDANLVGNLATKITGAVGQLYGSTVLLCDEFNAPAVDEFYAVAINTRNYVTTRLRGVRLERDRDVFNQRDVIVASQRLGFEDVIENAKSVAALAYAAS